MGRDRRCQRLTKKQIIIRRIRTEWTNGPNNGAYGIYPVQTTNVLRRQLLSPRQMPHLWSVRTDHVRATALNTMLGIDENSVGADVYNNVAVANTAAFCV